MKSAPATAPSSPDDLEVVRAAQSGAAWAQEVLVRRNFGLVRGMAYRLLGSSRELDDVVQEVFVQMLRSLRRVGDPALFRTWLGRVTMNVAISSLRERRRQRRWSELHRSMPLDTLPHASGASPELLGELRAVYRALDQLPEKRRIVLILRRIEELELTEIAAMMNTSLATIKRWLSRADRELAEAMEKGSA